MFLKRNVLKAHHQRVRHIIMDLLSSNNRDRTMRF